MEAVERQLLEILLAEMTLAASAADRVSPRRIANHGLRTIYEAIATSCASKPASASHETLIGEAMLQLAARPDLHEAAINLAVVGSQIQNRAAWLEKIVARLTAARAEPPAMDDAGALDLLARLQQTAKHTVELEPVLSYCQECNLNWPYSPNRSFCPNCEARMIVGSRAVSA